MPDFKNLEQKVKKCYLINFGKMSQKAMKLDFAKDGV